MRIFKYIEGMAATLVIAFIASLQLASQAQEQRAYQEPLNESGELSHIAKLNEGLDDEGKRLLNEFVQVLPKLDAKKLKAETAEKFPLSALDALKAEFDAKNAPFKIGETITVATRIKVYTGPFGGMRDGKLVVGNKLVPTIDLTQETMDRANPEIIAEKRREFLKKNYYDPKAACMLKAKEATFFDRLEKLEKFYVALAQEHGKGKVQPDKAGENVNIAAFTPVAPAPEASSEASPLPGQNAPAIVSADGKENLN